MTSVDKSRVTTGKQDPRPICTNMAYWYLQLNQQVIWAKLTWHAIAEVQPLWQSV